VVGEGQGVHAQLLGPPKQIVNPPQAVEEGVLAVHVKVNKAGHLLKSQWSLAADSFGSIGSVG